MIMMARERRSSSTQGAADELSFAEPYQSKFKAISQLAKTILCEKPMVPM